MNDNKNDKKQINDKYIINMTIDELMVYFEEIRKKSKKKKEQDIFYYE